MKKITLLLTLCLSVSAMSQTVYRLQKIEYYDWDNTAWVLDETETYTYENEGTKETLLLNESITNGQTQIYRHLKTYNSNNSITEDKVQTKVGSDWVNSNRNLTTYDEEDRIILSLYQVSDGTNWFDEEKTEYEYPDNETIIKNEYEYKTNAWVRINEETITATASGYIQITKTLVDDVLTNSEKFESIFENDKISEQIIWIWDESIPDWVFDGKYNAIYNIDGNLESEEIYYWNIDITPEEWAMNSKVTYTRSQTNPKLIKLFQDCESGTCTDVQRTLTNYDSNGDLQSSKSETWDPENGIWRDWNLYTYQYDANHNNTETILQRVDLFFQTEDLVNTSKTIKYWEEATALSVSFSNNKQLSIYPNPTTKTINITFKTPISSNQKLTLYNIQGQIIKQRNLNAGEQSVSLPIQQQNSGIYILNIQTNDNTKTYKIIKH
ncbi:T9SS type A sorting domain-containing protein [Aestuariibaculum marinum]|uniref:T9SS type A sorting domain-containing protein n=1 Tax=Aestuariibaculum marinum TaxID=2683592 RepID=A0A8J6PSD7_9FLAO|nr:T9SS type A sorting domain-containing protein [Aestuariibaculum marinum]MBD0823147.1 T9SS type A sorting domain-containing protein [Aestuariibaculum marinum]